MTPGISLMGNPYANDSTFWNAFGSFNPNAMAYYQQQLEAMKKVSQTAASTSAATDSTAAASPSFGSSVPASSDSGSGVGTGLVVGGAVVSGALACLAAYKHRDGNGVKAAFKNAWNAIVKSNGTKTASTVDGKVSEKLLALVKDSNLKEYTIRKNGMSFVMKDGKPVKIVTQDKKVIEKASDVAKWVRDNKSAVSEVRALDLNGTTLPKGVSLSYQKIISDGKNEYRMIVEGGKVVKAFSKNKDKKWVEVAEDQFEGFIRNHAKQVKEAETLTRTFGGKKVQLTDKKGNLVKQTGSIQMNVRNGQVVSAKFNGTRDLTKKELEALQKDYKDEIGRFGKENGSRYGLGGNYEYVYRQKGGQEIRFNSAKTIKKVDAVKEKEITNKDAVAKWLENNEEIATELNNIATSGAASTKGYRIGHMIYKTDAGNTFEINGDKILGIKLNEDIKLKGKDFKAGTLIDKEYLADWRKIAENNNEFEKVLNLIK